MILYKITIIETIFIPCRVKKGEVMLTIDLTGRVALVIGGSRGIGAGVVKALCQAGCQVFFTHTGNLRYRPSVEVLIEEIRREGWKAKDFVLDALDLEATKKLAESIVQDQGKIDILVCNVGKNLPRSVEEMDDKDWHSFIDINLTSAYYGIRAVLPHMVKRRYGRIILIGSSAVYDGGGGAICLLYTSPSPRD